MSNSLKASTCMARQYLYPSMAIRFFLELAHPRSRELELLLRPIAKKD